MALHLDTFTYTTARGGKLKVGTTRYWLKYLTSS